MRFSAAAVVAFAASVSAVVHGNNGTDFTTTKVVTSYTTYCPGPTSIVENGKTYTVTTATTLTITDCPCTLTYTYTSAPPATSAAETPAETPEAPVYPVPTGTGSPLPPANVTEPAPTYAAPSPSETTFEGAGNRVTVAGGALVGLLGAVAFLL